MLCRLSLREHRNEDVEPKPRICLYKSFQAHSIYFSKSIGRIVAAADRMNRDPTCRSMLTWFPQRRPLLLTRASAPC